MKSQNKYHSIVPFAFYCSVQTQQFDSIPRSTRYYWLKRNRQSLFDAGLLAHAEPLDILQAIARYKTLLKINKALLRCIALTKFVKSFANELKFKRQAVINTALGTFQKIAVITGFDNTRKLTGISYRKWLQWKNIRVCSSSAIRLCRRKHPAQLLTAETDMIIKICKEPLYKNWPLASVYHKALRMQLINCSISTFYKYSALLVIRAALPLSRRKNHHPGIRATKPFEIIHTDITQFITDTGQKAFIYLVQDNFSRVVLCHAVETERKAAHTIRLIKEAIAMRDNNVQNDALKLITDDGVENKTIQRTIPSSILTHLIAQKDISFSNSMIEYLNRTLKYRYLYQQKISSISELNTALETAIEDYNNRPAHQLNGLTPLEVLNNKQPERGKWSELIKAAAKNRIMVNKSIDCCYK